MASSLAAPADRESVGSNLLTVAELEKAALQVSGPLRSFQLTGIVCASVPRQGLLAFQDKTGTILMKLPLLSDTLCAGEEVRIEGTNCWITRTRFVIQINSSPLVDNDGIHGAITKSNHIFMEAGFQPLRLEWSHYTGPESLGLEYAGPGMPRQTIPDTTFWRNQRGTELLQTGLNFAAYNEGPLIRLPDFDNLAPVTNGVADRPDLSYAARTSETALVFNGYVRIPVAGNYTFYLTSEDGSRLYLGVPPVTCTVLRSNVAPQTIPLIQALADPSHGQWVELEGETVFAGANGYNLDLELLERGNHVAVTVVDGAPLFCSNLLHQRLRVDGLSEFSSLRQTGTFGAMVVPGVGQLKILEATETVFRNYATNDFLTTADQVRRLSQEQASLNIPAHIRGVVTAANQNSLVLEDTSGGVFIIFDSSNAVPPAVGQLWEVSGTTDRGDFSPVISAKHASFLGNAALPDPIRPTWDQLMNGSLDAEYVEIRGVVLARSDSEMTLLTPDGSVTVEASNERPLPWLPASSSGSLINSVVRIRGCLTAHWNADTHLVIPGRFYLYPAVTEIEDLAPRDAFSQPVTPMSDLLKFNARASALQQTKLSGQIVYARPGEDFLLDEHTGIRVLADQSSRPPGLQAGDLVEAVGFPRLGGASPVLQNAQIRVTSRAPLPAPVCLGETNLLDRGLDATLVQATGLLLSDSQHGRERVLELQSGAQHFAAILKSDGRSGTPFAPDSLLQLTGVYASEEQSPVGGSFYPFEILLNNTDAILVLHQPYWWTVRHAVMVAAVLTGVLALSFIWITVLHRQIEQRTAQLQEEIGARQLAEQHRVMEQERIRVARDLHDELGAGLTEVGILAALAKNPAIPPEEKEHYLAQLMDSASALVTGLDEIVWAINPQYDSLPSLATYYSLFAQRFLNLAGIACHLRVAESLPELPLDSKVRHGVFLAFKEALNNAVRHSGASEVEIKIELAGNQLAISVLDNGRGLAIAEAPGQDGVSGMHERLRQLGGECRIESRSDQGTAVEFRLKLNGIEDAEPSATT
jgi:signal transduction histidine kinase